MTPKKFLMKVKASNGYEWFHLHFVESLEQAQRLVDHLMQDQPNAICEIAIDQYPLPPKVVKIKNRDGKWVSPF